MLKNSTIKDFEDALIMLDQELKKANIKIKIRAIGGFAMMYYGFRENGYTIDIDSLTEAYPEAVLELIQKVGREKGIDEDWLNTDCSTLDGFLDPLSGEIEWQRANYSFDSIDLQIADVRGLIRSKAKAIQDGGLVPRSTDKKDLISGLVHVGIHDVEGLDQSQEYAFIASEYPRSYEYLKQAGKW